MKKIEMNISSFPAIALLSACLASALNLPLWRFLGRHLDITAANFAFAASIPFAIAAATAFLVNLLLFPKAGKILLAMLLTASAAASYMMLAYGVQMDPEQMRNIFETNLREAADLFSASAAAWIAAAGILPAALLCAAKITYRPLLAELRRRALFALACLLCLGAILGVFGKDYVSFVRNNMDVRGLLVPYNFLDALAKYAAAELREPREFQRLDPAAKLRGTQGKKPKAIILMIGETARAASFSLHGYGRETNPLLAKQDIAVFQNTSSCGTATATSLPCMFSGAGRKKFDLSEARYSENLADLVKQAGFEVVWLENDDGCKGVCKRVPTEDMVEKNSPKFCDGSYCLDEALLDGLDVRLGKITRNTMIVMHMMGSHGPSYHKRYPKEFARFQPSCDTNDLSACTREEIANAYDNTILYSDFVISSAIDELRNFPNLDISLVFASDHGESLGENGIYLHGLPYAVAPKEQTRIPMLMWTNQKGKAYDCLKRNAASEANAYSHDNLYHTVLGLAGIESKTYDPQLDVLTPCRER